MGDCESRKQQQQQEDPAPGHAEESQDGQDYKNGSGCPHMPFPDICDCDLTPCDKHDCDNERKAIEHRKILSKIVEIESTFYELMEAVDETVIGLLPVNHDLKIDSSIKDLDFHTKLRYFNSSCVVFGLHEEQYVCHHVAEQRR